MTSSIVVTRIKQGFQVSGPEGFEVVVLEKMLTMLHEVKNRANYLIGKDYETLGDKIVVVDFRGDKSKSCIQSLTE